jgi:hypothetical protein
MSGRRSSIERQSTRHSASASLKFTSPAPSRFASYRQLSVHCDLVSHHELWSAMIFVARVTDDQSRGAESRLPGSGAAR